MTFYFFIIFVCNVLYKKIDIKLINKVEQIGLFWIKVSYHILLVIPAFCGSIVNSDDQAPLNQPSSTTDSAYVNKLNQLAEQFETNSSLKFLEYTNNAIKISQKIGYCQGEITAGILKSRYWHYQGNYLKAIEESKKLISIAKNCGDSSKLIRVYGVLGYIYRDQGEHKHGLDYFSTALSIARKTKDPHDLAFILNNIAILYGEVKDYRQALKYYAEAVVLAETEKDYGMQTSCLGNMGGFCEYMGKNDSAKYYYQKAFEISQKSDNPKIHALGYKNVACIHELNSEYREALNNYLKAEKIFSESSESFDHCVVLYNIACILYYKLHEKKEAEQYLLKALHIAQKIQYKKMILKISKLLSGFYTANKDYKKANDYFQLHYSLKDSIQKEEYVRIAEQEKVKYEREIRDRQLTIKQKEIEVIKKQKSYSEKISILSAIAFLLLFVAVFLFYNKQKTILTRDKIIAEQEKMLRKSERKLMEIEIKNKELENMRLQEQISGKERELSNLALHMNHRNEMLERLGSEIKTMQKKTDKGRDFGDRILTLIHQEINIEKKRSEFELYMQQHREFISRLEKKYPELTKREKQLCVFLHLKLSSKEISSFLNVEVSSVEVSRYRLRKKLGLEAESSLGSFLSLI